jgi:excisionase family DNA binding protein
MEPILLSRKQAASLLSISLRGLDYLISQQKIRTRRIGKRVLIARHEIERFARASHPQPLAPKVDHVDKSNGAELSVLAAAREFGSGRVKGADK